MHDDVLTSLQNPRVKRIVRLRDRRDRDRQGLFVVEGKRDVHRALAAGLRLAEAYHCLDIGPLDIDPKHPPIEVSRAVMTKMSYRNAPTNILAVFHTPRPRLSDLTANADSVFLVAVATEKPGNLGAMARAASAFGCSALIAAEPNVDIYNPNTIRNSTGAIFSLPVVSTDASAVRTWLTDNHVRSIAAVVDGAIDCWSASFRTGPIALIVGPEHAGLDSQWQSSAELRIRIPQATGSVDSLNSATAATVLLYEVARQRSAS